MGAEPEPGPCPWCGLEVDAGLSSSRQRHGRRCPCGAIALGAATGDRRSRVDALVAYYAISPSGGHGDIYRDEGWLKDFSIEARPGAQDPRWRWYKRELPWEPPAGPMSDAERLEWLKAQGEKFYDLMYDSRSPRHEYRSAKDYFEGASELARRMGRVEEAEELARRLEHVKAVFRSQFD